MKSLCLFLIGLCLLLAGCGGGGGGGSSDSGNVNFFATDDLSTGYDGVWVKIYKVQLRRSNGTFATVFDDPVGKVVNLRALNDGAERYLFMGSDSVAEGDYNGLRVELDRAVTLFPTGSTTGLNRVFDDAYGTDRARLDLIFPSVKSIGAGSSNIVCDFDLSAWEDVGGEIRNALLDDSPGNGLGDEGRHQGEDYKGTISSLTGTAPNFTFVLNTTSGTKIEVETNVNTAIFNNSGEPNPTLSNGKRAEVRGKFSTVTNRLVASSIKIKGSGDDDPYEVKGEPSQANASLRRFKITTRECSGFLPGGTLVTINVNDSTRFITDSGITITEAQFFEMLPTESSLQVEAEGAVFDPNTNTLTAKKCKIENEGGGGSHEVEARGAPSNVNSVAGTFDITLSQWEGFNASVGQVIAVTTSGATEYKDGDNVSINAATFFSLLASSNFVKVEGTYEGGTIAARELSLRVSSGGGGGNDPHEIKGTPSSINGAARTFTVSLIEWYGFNGSIGQQIQVTMSSQATYRDDEGNSITQEQFFAKLGNGWLAEVEGTVSGSSMVGAKAKLDDH